MSAEGGTRAVVAALSANLAIAVVKFGGLLLQASRPGTLMLGASLLGMKVGGRFRRFFGNASQTSDPDDSPTAIVPLAQLFEFVVPTPRNPNSIAIFE